MKMEIKKIRIGELAEKLGVERFVIRFWEKEFGLRSTRSSGGQRFYSEHDYKIFATIKHLLYSEGFTICGAKKHLSEQRTSTPAKATAVEAKKETVARKTDWDQEGLVQHISLLKKQLQKLRELL